MRRGMQEIEQRAQREIDYEQRHHLIEAHDEARRPAPAQQRELESTAEVATEGREPAVARRR